MVKYLKVNDKTISPIFDAVWDDHAPYILWHRLTVPDSDSGYVKSLLALTSRTHSVHFEVSSTRNVFYLAPAYKLEPVDAV